MTIILAIITWACGIVWYLALFELIVRFGTDYDREYLFVLLKNLDYSVRDGEYLWVALTLAALCVWPVWVGFYIRYARQERALEVARELTGLEF